MGTLTKNNTLWYDEIGYMYDNQNNIDYEGIIISKYKDGRACSYFIDDIWDLRFYEEYILEEKSIVNFKKIDKNYRQDIKQIFFYILMYATSRFGRQLSASTLIRGYFNKALVPISKFLKLNDYTIENFFEKDTVFKKYINFSAKKGSRLTNIPGLLSFLSSLKNDTLTFKILISTKLQEEVKFIVKQYWKDKKQTLVIPFDIYKSTIKERWEHIDYVSNYRNDLKLFIIHYMGGQAKHDNPYNEFEHYTKKYNLQDLFKKYSLKNRTNFISFIIGLQITSKHLIHAYSGMRNKEVNSLRNDCFKNKGTYYAIEGVTTKLTGYEKRTSWITVQKIESVIKLLSLISNAIIYNARTEISLETYPLFVTPNYLKNTMNKCILDRVKISNFQNLDNELYIKSNIISIKDIQFLENIDPFEDWRRDSKTQIGQKWHFTTHQYRRSLAVYTIRSGKVSLGVLQIQLKHLFNEMTMYYAKGASEIFSDKEIVNFDSELSREFKKARAETEAMLYLKEVILSDEKLFGTAGKFIENNIKDKLSGVIVKQTKDETIKKFQKGEIAYKATAIGGCISTESCDYALTRSIVACAGCDSSIIKKSKLDNVINKQKEFIEFLDKDSIEYRTEMSDLEELKKQRKQFLGSKA